MTTQEFAPPRAQTSQARAAELVAPVANAILENAARTEEERQLPASLMSQLMDAGLFSIYTPKQFGGMGLELPDALRVVEEVSRFDGSTGWTVALGVGNDLFTCVVPDESAARILGNGAALIAGSPGFMVRAVAVDGGYRLTGQWQFASGAPNAHWMSVAAPVFDDDKPRMGPAGPEMVFAIMSPSDVEIVDTWNVTGMRGTGSHDLRVNNVFVPYEMAGPFAMPLGPRAVRETRLAEIPFMTVLAIVQSPPVCLGITRHAIDEFRRIALEKERPPAPRLSEQVQAQEGLAHAEALLRSARCYWYETVESTWDTVTAGRQLSLEDRTAVRLASLTATENCVQAVDIVYRLGGSTSIFQSTPLERCWRDVHTAAQHFQVQYGRWETAGRVLFGLDPASPFV